MKTLDAGQAETNKLIEKVEKRVNKEYTQATKDMQKKLNNYLKSFESKDKAMQKQLADGLITEKQYKDWRFGQIMTGKRWQEQLDVLSKDLENSRQIALNIVSGELPSAYAIGHNYGTYLVESGTSLNTSYTLYNRDTVSKLIKDRPKLLPDPTKGSKTQKALQEKRIQKWSKAKMTSAIAQGVLQGEAIPKIASRLRNVTDMSYRASIRNARTMLTSSENLGRQASFERAQDMGIEMEKQWLATLDDRTRDSHALMDGERVPLDENFSNGLEYPADPSGEPEEIYNCRCTMVTAIKGFEKALTDFDLSENEKLHGMSYDEWKESHREQEGITVDFGNATNLLSINADDVRDYGNRMSQDDIDIFNDIFGEANYKKSENGSYYYPDDNTVYLDGDSARPETLYHESTHWFDYNQNYTLADDWGGYKNIFDDDGNIIERKYVPNIVVVKENAGFSEYIAHKWDMYELGKDSTMAGEDLRNFVKKVGTSDTYGYGRTEAPKDVEAINNYLKSKGVSKSDTDFGHLSDFISAISYDSNLGSLTTGGHSYEYWVSSSTNRVTEITAGYNVLKTLGRYDLIEVEKDLAPNLMNLIETEWSKIWEKK